MRYARYAIFVGLLVMTGCAGSRIAGMSPAELRTVSDRKICLTYTHPGGRYATLSLETEVKRRGLICSYAAAKNEAAARRSLEQFRAGMEMMNNSRGTVYPPPPNPPAAAQPWQPSPPPPAFWRR